MSFVFLSSSFGKCETELLAAPQVLPCLLWSETGSGDPGVLEEELREKGKETGIKQYQFYVELGSRKEKEIFELLYGVLQQTGKVGDAMEGTYSLIGLDYPVLFHNIGMLPSLL